MRRRCVPHEVQVPEREAVARGQGRVPEDRAEVPEARVEVQVDHELEQEDQEREHVVQQEVHEHDLMVPSLLAAEDDSQAPEAPEGEEAVQEGECDTAGQH